MEKKLTSATGEQLLHARQESLRNGAEGSLRPLGKLWGMDVFTWHDPFIGILSNTIHSFPFPVIWVGNHQEVVAALSEDDLLISNLHSVIITDNGSFTLDAKWVGSLKNCVGTGSVSDAMEMLKVFKAPQKVLLFTASGDLSLEQRNEFESYVKLVQGQ